MYGIFPRQQLPEQNAETARILMERWLRAATPHRKWAETGKLCQDFFESRQLTEEQIVALKRDNRPILILNKIAPLIRLVSGYQRNNRTDINFLPTNDMSASEDTADVLSMIVKSDANRNDLVYTDSEVFYDGIITGRGWWDYRLNFDANDFGDTKICCGDPFSIYVDPDADTYNLNDSANYITESRWTSLDEVEFNYGKDVADSLRAKAYFGNNSEFLGGPYGLAEEISPIRKFALTANEYGMSVNDLYYTEFVDTYQKRIRLIDTQYYIHEWRRHFIDLETGDHTVIPDSWDDDKIRKCLLYAQNLKQRVVVDWRKAKRIRWTVMCGDITVFDGWSPYKTFTKIAFFPYFRRGVTQGLVQDLIDPQRELNKRRISTTEILTRNANSGWMYHVDSLDPRQKENLKKHGSRPGINIEWKGTDAAKKPIRIEPGGYPIGHDKLEEKSRSDLLEISGINESALGELDKVQSGRAIEARQRQSVIALQPYLDNYSRSKKLQGVKFLELIQDHYTEHRIIRTIGEDGGMAMQEINKLMQPQPGQMPTNGTQEILNDVTVGKYEVQVNETPMSATFENAQFEEALDVLQKLGPVGEMLLQTKPDLLIQMSSLPRKEEWITALQQAVAQIQQQKAAAGQGAAGAGGPPPGAAGGPAPPPPPQAPAPAPPGPPAPGPPPAITLAPAQVAIGPSPQPPA